MNLDIDRLETEVRRLSKREREAAKLFSDAVPVFMDDSEAAVLWEKLRAQWLANMTQEDKDDE